MNIVVVNGSMRSKSQSLKVSEWLANHANTLDDVNSEVIDLHKDRLPLFDLGETEPANDEMILGKLADADAAVLVSPEWNGMMSHSIANLMNYLGTELAHKPVMLVGVSAGRNGHYPVSQMRQMGYKNNHFVISPEALIVQGVNDILNDTDMSDDAADGSVKKRADYALRILAEYAKALKYVRDSGVVDHENFANGV